MIIVYTGTGKGKTSAAIGHVIRAYGAGLSIAFCQFIKQDGVAGEQEVLKKLLGNENVYIGGSGFVRGEKNFNTHIRAAVKTLEWANNSKADLIVLDEVIDAISRTLIPEFALEKLIDESKGSEARHLVITGHEAEKCKKIWESADYITIFETKRHPNGKGRKAIKGVEY